MRRLLLATLLLTTTSVALGASPTAAGGGCHGAQTEGAGTTVEMKNMCFTPTALRVDTGTEVEFVNRDSVGHVVVGVGWGEWNELGMGDSTTHRFDEPGAYPYTCNLHSGMSGVVIVGDDEPPLTTEPISTARDAASGSISPAWAGLVVLAVVAAVFAGRLTATRGSRR